MCEKDELTEPVLDEKTTRDLLGIVHQKNWEYSIEEVIQWMEEKGYDHVGKIIMDAISGNILSISTIEDDATVWLELGVDGEDLWDEYYKGKEGFSEEGSSEND